MAMFQVDWTEETWHRTVVEADSAEQAREMLWSGEIDSSDTAYDGEIQDDVEIAEVQ